MRSFTFACIKTGVIFRTTAETIWHAKSIALTHFGHHGFRAMTSMK